MVYPRIRIAFESSHDGHPQVYRMRSGGSNQRNVSRTSSDDTNPAWSPRGGILAFTSDRDGNQEIYSMRWNGHKVVRLTENTALDTIPSWGWLRPGSWVRGL